MLFCEADTKNMVVLIKAPFLCMLCGYFGEKKHERNMVSDMPTFLIWDGGFAVPFYSVQDCSRDYSEVHGL